MKKKAFSAFAFAFFLTISAYAQDSSKAIRQQEKAERKARVKEDVKNTGRAIGETADEAGQGIKSKAKAAGAAIDTAASKAERGINRGLDKAENALVNERDKLRAKSDSAKAAKARRDSL